MIAGERKDEFAPRAEEDLVPRKKVWVTAGAAAVVAVVAIVAANEILRASTRARSPSISAPTVASSQIGIVEQTLLLDSRRGLDKNAADERVLRHFGWSDRAHGVARVPIDRAMDLVADPGFRARAFESGTPRRDTYGRGGP